jgi:branched-chain amino acid transport system substrate-binding protein
MQIMIDRQIKKITGGRTMFLLRMAGLIALFGWISAATAMAEDVLGIGVQNDQSGVYADGTGAGATAAAQLAAEDFGGHVAGMTIKVLSADNQNKADIGASIARNWIERGEVETIVDLGSSAAALAVNDIVRDANKVMLVSSASAPQLTGKSCTPNTIAWTYNPAALAAPLAKALYDRGDDTWFFITVDYVFGHALQAGATRAIEQLGGKVVGSVQHPLNTLDFSSLLLQAQASNAKVVALANGGDDVVRAIKQAHEFGLTPKQTLVGLSTNIGDIHAMGLGTAQGLLLTEATYWDLDDRTRALSKRFAEKYRGRMPTMMQAGAYGAVLHYLKAVQAVGSAKDGAKVVAKMKELPSDDPFFGKGYVRIDGRAVHDMYVFQVKTPSESHYAWDYYRMLAKIPGEQAFGSKPSPDCSLVAKN